jgi:hypothetical protein
VGVIKFELTEPPQTSNSHSLSRFSRSESLHVANEELMKDITLTFINTSVANLKNLAGVGENDDWDDDVATRLREKIRAKADELGLTV